MFDRIYTVLQAECLLSRDQPVLLGVSGGPDSLCLLDTLARSGYAVIVAHLNHRLRPEAESEAKKVAEIANKLGMPFVLGVEDVRSFAQSHSLSLEEAARLLRYRFLFQEAQTAGAQAVAVGHTADDQVETVLMHLLRGAGLSGLKGMAYRSHPTVWSETIPLVRPLLGEWREEILAYLAERGLEPTFDASNLDTTYFRNRLRHDLIPYLEQYNPQIRQSLWRMAFVLQGDHAIVQEAVEAAWQTCRIESGQGFVAFNRRLFTLQPDGLQRHLLRRAIARLRPGLRDVEFQTVERGLRLLSATEGSGQCDLLAGLRLYLENERAWVISADAELPKMDWPQLDPGPALLLPVPGKVSLRGGWELRASLIEDGGEVFDQAIRNTNDFQAWIDRDKLDIPLRVRARQPGDRFKPLGMEGHSVKLSDYMINEKLPSRARAAWPLVLSGDEVVWVPGYRLAEPYQVRPESRAAVYLQLSRSPV